LVDETLRALLERFASLLDVAHDFRHLGEFLVGGVGLAIKPCKVTRNLLGQFWQQLLQLALGQLRRGVQQVRVVRLEGGDRFVRGVPGNRRGVVEPASLRKRQPLLVLQHSVLVLLTDLQRLPNWPYRVKTHQGQGWYRLNFPVAFAYKRPCKAVRH
jgi:hypothetical protein